MWSDLHEVVRSARSLFVCCPYYSNAGLRHIEDHLKRCASVKVFVRLNAPDWADGVIDPKALSAFAKRLAERRVAVEIAFSRRLHAKVYSADSALVLLGSSNLSGGGFGSNTELMVRLRGVTARVALRAIHEHLVGAVRPIDVADLDVWIKRTLPLIVGARKRTNRQSRTLAGAEIDLDDILRVARRRDRLPMPSQADLDKFIAWLRRNSRLPGAVRLLEQRVENDKRNSGKVIQSFAGAMRFLDESPRFGDRLRSSLRALRRGELYQIEDESMRAAWIKHLRSHADDVKHPFKYPTLIKYLSPKLGGTPKRGGGGDSEFKRTLPLVALFIAQNQP